MGLLPTRKDGNIQDDEYEGQLAVDVSQDDEKITIIAPIAGVKIKDINISISDNVLKIEGSRMVNDPEETKEYLIQECYWGPFSREIILPGNVDPSHVSAQFKDGVLHVHILRQDISAKIKSIEITQ